MFFSSNPYSPALVRYSSGNMWIKYSNIGEGSKSRLCLFVSLSNVAYVDTRDILSCITFNDSSFTESASIISSDYSVWHSLTDHGLVLDCTRLIGFARDRSFVLCYIDGNWQQRDLHYKIYPE